MGAQRIPVPVTVAEWEKIPNPPDGHYELHHGEIVLVTRPVRRHWDLQRRLERLLAAVYEPARYVVGVEYPYRPLPENEIWGADVACIARERHEAVEKWLLGSPEFVIEVKSPSNTKTELNDKAMTTLAGHGAVEFWIVDPETQSVTVHRKSGMAVYRAQQDIPLSGTDSSLSVDAIFVDIR